MKIDFSRGKRAFFIGKIRFSPMKKEVIESRFLIFLLGKWAFSLGKLAFLESRRVRRGSVAFVVVPLTSNVVHHDEHDEPTTNTKVPSVDQAFLPTTPRKGIVIVVK